MALPNAAAPVATAAAVSSEKKKTRNVFKIHNAKEAAEFVEKVSILTAGGMSKKEISEELEFSSVGGFQNALVTACIKAKTIPPELLDRSKSADSWRDELTVRKTGSEKEGTLSSVLRIGSANLKAIGADTLGDVVSCKVETIGGMKGLFVVFKEHAKPEETKAA